MTRNIGILGAMAQEIDEVKALLTEKTVVKIANREFVVGKIGNVRCVVACHDYRHLINTRVRRHRLDFHRHGRRIGRWLEGGRHRFIQAIGAARFGRTTYHFALRASLAQPRLCGQRPRPDRFGRTCRDKPY